MDSWRVAVLGDGGVGKTALAVQVSLLCKYPEGHSLIVLFCPSSLSIALLVRHPKNLCTIFLE